MKIKGKHNYSELFVFLCYEVWSSPSLTITSESPLVFRGHTNHKCSPSFRLCDFTSWWWKASWEFPSPELVKIISESLECCYKSWKCISSPSKGKNFCLLVQAGTNKETWYSQMWAQTLSIPTLARMSPFFAAENMLLWHKNKELLSFWDKLVLQLLLLL